MGSLVRRDEAVVVAAADVPRQLQAAQRVRMQRRRAVVAPADEGAAR